MEQPGTRWLASGGAALAAEAADRPKALRRGVPASGEGSHGEAHPYDMAGQGGNGVTATIALGSRRLWTARIANGDRQGRSFQLRVSVNRGDALHFRIDSDGNNDFDTTAFDPGVDTGEPPCPSGDHALCTLIALTFATSTDGGRSYHQPPVPTRVLAAPPYRYQPDAMRAPWQPSNIVKSPADGAYYLLVQRDDHGPAVGGDVQGTCVLRTRTLDDPGPHPGTSTPPARRPTCSTHASTARTRAITTFSG